MFSFEATRSIECATGVVLGDRFKTHFYVRVLDFRVANETVTGFLSSIQKCTVLAVSNDYNCENI